MEKNDLKIVNRVVSKLDNLLIDTDGMVNLFYTTNANTIQLISNLPMILDGIDYCDKIKNEVLDNLKLEGFTGTYETIAQGRCGFVLGLKD